MSEEEIEYEIPLFFSQPLAPVQLHQYKARPIDRPYVTPSSLRVFPKQSAFTYSTPFPAATIDTESDLAQHQLEMRGERVWCNHNYSLAMMVLSGGKAALVPLEDVYDVAANLSKVEDKEELLLYQKYEQEPIYEPKPLLETNGIDFRVIKDPQSVGK